MVSRDKNAITIHTNCKSGANPSWKFLLAGESEVFSWVKVQFDLKQHGPDQPCAVMKIHVPVIKYGISAIHSTIQYFCLLV